MKKFLKLIFLLLLVFALLGSFYKYYYAKTNDTVSLVGTVRSVANDHITLQEKHILKKIEITQNTKIYFNKSLVPKARLKPKQRLVVLGQRELDGDIEALIIHLLDN
ncbi:hypothetical protein [Carboxydothermus ferrireducens]|uniref:DUF5666 domain-containing protein n=1 Tax=Carboxydothermus ferrireducens DSM 11255 TaxID=1119529 RepID=A0ABX2RBM9_9THEO|nr:hypothetical protein [Carboxydothermus ferrireducens]NYE58581.1 hypothetical protein [Carboxydothermus ferrireducens DSM 11255]